jgi:hypothetical protein
MNNLIVLRICFLLTGSTIFAILYSRNGRVERYSERARDQMGGDSNDKLLQIEMCNGYGNQIISLLSAISIASRSKRRIVIPQFVLDGRQIDVQSVDASSSLTSPLDQIIELPKLKGPSMPNFVSADQINGINFTAIDSDVYDESFFMISANIQNLKIGCPAFKLPKSSLLPHRDILEQAMQAIRPSRYYLELQHKCFNILEIEETYNALHYRAEKDWILHCEQWQAIDDGIVRDNCLNNTFDIGYSLLNHGLDPKIQLVILMDEENISDKLMTSLKTSLSAWGFRNFTILGSWLFDQLDHKHLHREERAMISFNIAFQSNHFIGNSVSSFSALLIAKRRMGGLKASYYNGGNIPLEDFLPIFSLAWLTTANDKMNEEYFNMLKASIVSGKRAGLRPYVLYQGLKDSSIYKWLESENIVIIIHDLSIEAALLRLVETDRELHMESSHLYGSDDAVIGTWQRIDIPILDVIRHENFILFTDCDVVFQANISLADFPAPLPKFMAMAEERFQGFPYNAGVILFNMVAMSESYQGFIKWILNQNNGLYYGKYGPGDQGAYNEYYEKPLKENLLTQQFNAKPYHQTHLKTKIIHFHGPKVHDYVEYLETGSCRFGDLCLEGITKGSVCKYADYIVSVASFWSDAVSLQRLCQMRNLQLDSR